MDPATIRAVLDDWTSAPINERLRAALQLVETMTKHPQDLDAQLLASLRERGLEREAIEDAASIAFQYNMINRFADAFDFVRPDDRQRLALARMLDFAAKHVPRTPHATLRGDDGLVRPRGVELGRKVALQSPGHTPPQLREAVESVAARWFGGRRPPSLELEAPLQVYVDKVARWAYKVVDEDVDALKAAGYEDQAIFELTFAAALGASTPALEQLFAALGEAGS